MEVNVVASEVGEHVFTYDVVTHVTTKLDGELWKFGCIFLVQFVVFCNEVCIGRICGHGDGVDKVEAWYSCD